MTSPTPPEAAEVHHGAVYLGGGRTRFSVWAPRARRVELVVDGAVAGVLGSERDGYHVGIYHATPTARYGYLLDGRGPFADPASRSQPEGVHGLSEVVETLVARQVEGFRGVPRAAQVICEVHVGTFSAAGTFEGVIDGLARLKAAGYTMVELMPIGTFPGRRNWGYDVAFPFATQASYGGRGGLARLVDRAHRAGLGVIVDVVYNHIGPEGAVFEEYGPYLSAQYATPWGRAMNLDGEGSDEVRRFFVEHSISLLREFGVDGLRLDAAHEIVDRCASPFLAELAAALQAEARRQGRLVSVFAESPANDPRLITPAELGGIGLDGVWNDDFHHALRATLTGDRDRYFADYRGVSDLAHALSEGFVLTGRHAPSRGRRHGARLPARFAGERLVVFAQNHDQIGNGGFGRRLAATLPFAAQFPITALVCCSGFVPLRFMGEEYGERAPFYYFTDHGDAELIEAVRVGRQAEVGQDFELVAPDPQDPGTLRAAVLTPPEALEPAQEELLSWQAQLLELRQEHPALGSLEPWRSSCCFDDEEQGLVLLRRADPYLGARPVAIVANLRRVPIQLTPPLLAQCRLEVIAAHGAGGLACGDHLGPDLDGRVVLRLDPYGVLLATVREPGGEHLVESWRRDTVGAGPPE